MTTTSQRLDAGYRFDPVPRHTRPTPPRKRPGIVRSLVGVAGELLLTAGVVLGLYLVWQLWWTSVEAQGQAEAIMTAYQNTLTPAAPTTGELRTDAPPVPEAGAWGQTTGVLIVPRWDGKTRNAMPIVEGIDKELLDQALAGHYPGTGQVGEVGNFALAGHRRTYGDSFRYVPDLRTGDQVIVETASTWYVYEVTGYEIVLPTQTEVIEPVPGQPGAQPTERILTLTTCTTPDGGEYGNSHRWITYAKFTGWMDRAAGTPEQVLAIGGGA